MMQYDDWNVFSHILQFYIFDISSSWLILLNFVATVREFEECCQSSTKSCINRRKPCGSCSCVDVGLYLLHRVRNNNVFSADDYYVAFSGGTRDVAVSVSEGVFSCRARWSRHVWQARWLITDSDTGMTVLIDFTAAAAVRRNRCLQLA